MCKKIHAFYFSSVSAIQRFILPRSIWRLRHRAAVGNISQSCNKARRTDAHARLTLSVKWATRHRFGDGQPMIRVLGWRSMGASELTGKRMQEGNALKAIYDSDLKRRVCFYRNSDGTFGFLEWRFCEMENSWVPARVGQGFRLSTI